MKPILPQPLMPETTSIDWPEMLKTHEPWLRKVLRCRIGDVHAVDDLFQEIAVAVYRQLGNPIQASSGDTPTAEKQTLPKDPEKVGPWLYRVAIRQSINFHRKQSRKSQPKMLADIVVPASAPEPLEWMLNREVDQKLGQCISKLDDGEREILMLKFTENWSYQQLADRLGVSTRAVEHRLLKARKKLRSLLVESSVELGAEND